MAWELFTREDVSDDVGVASNDMTEAMYDAAVAFAERWLNRKLTASASYTESLDGDGTDTLFVSYTPIIAVSSLSIDGVAMSGTSYVVYSTHIRLDNILYDEVNKAIFGPAPVFPIGQKNVAVTYTAGIAAASVPADIKYGLKLMIAQMSLNEQRKGADASFAFDFSQSGQNGESDPQGGTGLSRAMLAIARTWFGKGVRVW